MSRRQRAWLIGLLVTFALMPVVFGIRGGEASILTSDFTVLYTGATLVRHGHPAAVYDPAQMRVALLRESQGRIDPQLAFDKPLADALPFVPLTLLPLIVAFRVWQLITLVLLAVAVGLLARAQPLGRSAMAWGLLGVLAAEPTWATLTEGQLGGVLVLGTVALLLAARDDAPEWGLLGGVLMAAKPQYLPAFLLVLVASRSLRALGAALAGSTGVVFSAVAAGGPATVVAMVHAMLHGAGITDVRSMESWEALVALVVPPAQANQVGLAVFSVVLASLGVLAMRRLELLPFAALAGMLALLGSPHTLPHDAVLLLVPAWVGFALARAGRLASPMLGLACLQAAWVLDLHGWPVSLGAFVLTGVLGFYVWDFTRRGAARPRLAAAA